MKRILIGGYYGYGNIGDEAILEAFSERISSFPDIELTVLSSNRQYTSSIHGLYSVSRKNLIAIIKALVSIDLLISGGGGLIQDSTSRMSPFYYLFQIFLAQILGCKFYVMGQGIGPIESSFTRSVMGDLFSSAEAIVIRDIESKNLLLNVLPAGKEIILGADLALLLQPASEDNATDIFYDEDIDDLPRPLLACILKGNPKNLKNIAYIADALNSCLEQVGGSVLFIPFYPAEDLKFNEMIMARLKYPTAIIRKSHKPSEILSLFKKIDHILAGRLHALIFSALVATPFTPIVYDPKMNIFLEELGLTSSVITPLVGSHSLEEAILNDIESAPDIIEKAKNRLQPLKDRAELNISKLLEILI